MEGARRGSSTTRRSFSLMDESCIDESQSQHSFSLIDVVIERIESNRNLMAGIEDDSSSASSSNSRAKMPAKGVYPNGEEDIKDTKQSYFKAQAALGVTKDDKNSFKAHAVAATRSCGDGTANAPEDPFWWKPHPDAAGNLKSTIPGAYSGMPGQEELIRQVSAPLSKMPAGSAEFVMGEETEREVNDGNLNREREGQQRQPEQPELLASAELVEPQVTHEALPVTNADLICQFVHTSMGGVLVLAAGLFAIGLITTYLLAIFKWYEPAFVLAMAFALMVLLAVALQAAAKMRTRNNPKKVLLLLLILAAAALVAFGVYWSSRHAQQEDFRSKFDGLAMRLVDGFHDNARLRLQVMDMLSVSITSTAMATGQTWPFVTIPDFDARATSARALVGSINVGLYPYVTLDNRKEWENYTMHHMGWINASHEFGADFQQRHDRSHNGYQEPNTRRLDSNEYQEEDDDYYHPPAPNVSWTGTDGSSPEIYRYGRREGEGYMVVDDSPGPYYPMWQLSPIREATELYVNYNSNDPYLGEAYTNALESVRRTQSAVFGGVWNVDDDGYILEDDDYDTRTVPASAVMYPVFDKVVGQNRTVVGVLEFDLEFGPFFRRILPPNSNSIICVVSSPCAQTFSYEINGASATYVGAYDVTQVEEERSSSLEDMEVTALLADFDDQDGMEYNGAPANQEYCPWTLTVYPTKELESEYVDNSPIYYACAISSVFLFTCLVIVIFSSVFGKEKHTAICHSSKKLKDEEHSARVTPTVVMSLSTSGEPGETSDLMGQSAHASLPENPSEVTV